MRQANARSVLHSYSLATEHDPQWAKAWHTWAHANWDAIRTSTIIQSDPDLVNTESAADIKSHAVAAIDGRPVCFRCILV